MLIPTRHLALTMTLLGASAVTLGWTNTAAADAYLGLDGSSVSVENGVVEDLNPRGLRLRLGTRLSDLFDVEAHAGFSNDSTTRAFDDFGTAYVGAFLKGYIPIGNRSAVYGLAGVAAVKLTQSIGDTKVSDDRTSFAWGAGLETELTDRLDLTADYLSYSNNDGLFKDISAISLGLKLYF